MNAVKKGIFEFATFDTIYHFKYYKGYQFILVYCVRTNALKMKIIKTNNSGAMNTGGNNEKNTLKHERKYYVYYPHYTIQ